MADPLSIAASVLAVVGAATNVIKTGSSLVKTLRHAPTEICALINEVEDLRAILLDIEGTKIIPAEASNLLKFLGRARSKLDKLDNLISQRLTKAHSSEACRPSYARFTWLRERSRAKTLQWELRELRLNILASLTTTMSSGQRRVELAVNQVSVVTNQFSADHHHSIDEITDRFDAQDRRLDHLAIQMLQIQSFFEAQNRTREMIEQVHEAFVASNKGKGGLYALSGSATITPSMHIETATAIQVRTSYRRVTLCDPACRCSCHSERRKRTPRFLSRLMGSLFLGYTGVPIFPRPCDDSLCAQRSFPSAHLTYFFPEWFFRRMLTLALALDPVGGPQVALRMPRILPDTAKIFHLATSGDIDAIKAMFKTGQASPFDVSSSFGYSVLHFAIDLEHVELCKFLMNEGANPHVANKSQLTPVDLAWNRILGKTTDVTTRRALRALFDSTSQAEQIERRRFSRLQQTVLELTHDDLELELKNAGLEEINSKDSEGNTVLSWAARRADRAATLVLLSRGAEHHHLSKSGMSALHYAAGAKYPSCILPLLEAGAEVDVVNLWSETPLHVCALRQNDPESFMKPLLTYGADPNACDHEGSNVLSFAVQANHPQTVRYLLDYGVDMDIPDEGGLTSLGVAVLYNHHQILRMLLGRGADYTTLTMNRESILHLAAKNSDAETFSIIGAAHLVLPCDAVDCDGLTPLECVRQRDDPELIQSFMGVLESLRDTHHAKAAPGSEKSDSEWETENENEVYADSLEYQHPTSGLVPSAIAIFDDSTDVLVEDNNSNEIINPLKIWEC